MKTSIYLCAGIVAMGAAASANAEFIDFEGLSHGDFVTNQLAGQGISSVTTDTTWGAMVFDSTPATGEDTDLNTPVSGTVGPGATNGAFDNVLIISEDGSQQFPDDNAGGGTIRFDLSYVAYDLVLNIIDIEEAGGSVEIFLGGSSVGSAPILEYNDNSLQRVAIGDTRFDRIDVTLVGSGAVGDIQFVPTPGTLALAGMAGVPFVTRRRKA